LAESYYTPPASIGPAATFAANTTFTGMTTRGIAAGLSNNAPKNDPITAV
jgi:hypothetical protein